MKLTLAVLATILAMPTFAYAENNIHITGSSTVLPFSTIAAEYFGENFQKD